MSFCPLESYEWEETKAECGCSGVLLMSSLLPICDIRWRAQGNYQGEEKALPLYPAACMYKWIWRLKKKKPAKQLAVLDISASIGKKELDMMERKITPITWRVHWDGTCHLNKGTFSLPGVKLSVWLGGICCPTFPLWPYTEPRGNKHTGLSSISHLTLSCSHSLTVFPFLWQMHIVPSVHIEHLQCHTEFWMPFVLQDLNRSLHDDLLLYLWRGL